MSKTVSVTKAEREILFRVISDWAQSYGEYYDAEREYGHITEEEYESEWVADTRALSKILTKLDLVDNVFHAHVGQEHIVCSACENKRENYDNHVVREV